jgi:hypothetical protein
LSNPITLHILFGPHMGPHHLPNECSAARSFIAVVVKLLHVRVLHCELDHTLQIADDVNTSTQSSSAGYWRLPLNRGLLLFES